MTDRLGLAQEVKELQANRDRLAAEFQENQKKLEAKANELIKLNTDELG
tara:strand:- start:93 stop:239 length:147 start_codon:yes stop_codon:yes gene_type:complete